jgi:hypothetical protein
MIIADRNGRDSTGANGEADNDDDNNFEKFAQKYRNSKDLVLDPMDYPDTVAAVFKYGARGRFASWSSFARYVLCNVSYVHVSNRTTITCRSYPTLPFEILSRLSLRPLTA